jgi:hypothetical protein
MNQMGANWQKNGGSPKSMNPVFHFGFFQN